MDDANNIEVQVNWLKALFGRLREQQQEAPGGPMSMSGQGVNVMCQMLDGIIATLSVGIATDEELMAMVEKEEPASAE
jgi:hypothetical protein